MSRIGKKIIEVPAGVKVAIKDGTVNIEGPKGKLNHKLPGGVKVTWAESEKAIKCEVEGTNRDDKQLMANWGSTRAHIRNMVEGVTKGYEKTLEVVGVGWSAALTGKKLKLTVGFANPIILDVPEGLSVVVDKAIVRVSGPNKQLVGQFASAARSSRKPEPYNGKGVKYTTETIKRKQGKQFGA
jgi:large subunit ribosomal protein L6